MDRDTIQVELPERVTRLVWNAVFDDDDMAGMLIEAAIVGGTSHMVSNLRDRYPPEREAVHHEVLGECRAACARQLPEFTERMRAYMDPDYVPF